MLADAGYMKKTSSLATPYLYYKGPIYNLETRSKIACGLVRFHFTHLKNNRNPVSAFRALVGFLFVKAGVFKWEFSHQIHEYSPNKLARRFKMNSIPSTSRESMGEISWATIFMKYLAPISH